MIAAGLVFSRLLHLSAVLVLFGAAVFPLYSGVASARVQRSVVAAAVVALIGGVLWYLFTAAGMSGNLSGALDWSVLSLVGGATAFGHLWLARLALIAAALVAFAFTSRNLWLLGTAFATIALITIPWAGHGQDGEGIGAIIHAAGDVVHLLAAATWIGALSTLLLLLRKRKGGGQWEVTAALIGFSTIGPATVALLLLSEIANSWFMVGPANAISILRTDYGAKMLVAKLILFAGMLVLATLNRFQLTPRLALAGNSLATADALQALNRSVMAETVLAILVLAAVAVMGTLPPPAS